MKLKCCERALEGDELGRLKHCFYCMFGYFHYDGPIDTSLRQAYHLEVVLPLGGSNSIFVH